MRKLRAHLSYANVMVTVLAFVVLGGGGAYAATHLSKNSVGTKQIKPGAVTLSKINAAAASALKGQGVNGVPAGGDLTGSYPNPTLRPPGAWQDVSFQTGWSNFGSTFAPTQCYLDASGVVHLRGAAKTAASAGQQVMTLPSACRPSHTLEILAATLSSIGNGTGSAALEVDSSGIVIIETGVPGTGAGAAFDGVSFRPSN